MPQDPEEIISTSYSIPFELKERLENTARAQDLKTSQLLRRILREYFESVDADLEAAKAEAALS